MLVLHPNLFITYFVWKSHRGKTISQPGLAWSWANQVRLSAIPQYADTRQSEIGCLWHNSHLSLLLSLLSTVEAKRVLRLSPYERLLLWPKLQLHAKCHCYFITAEISAHAVQHRRPCLLAAHLAAQLCHADTDRSREYSVSACIASKSLAQGEGKSIESSPHVLFSGKMPETISALVNLFPTSLGRARSPCQGLP